jgi:hypothetical protein
MLDSTLTIVNIVFLMVEHEAAASTRSVNEADIVDALMAVDDLDIMGDFHLDKFLNEMQDRYKVNKDNILQYIYEYEE